MLKKKQLSRRACSTCCVRYGDAPWTLMSTNLPAFRRMCVYFLEQNLEMIGRCHKGEIAPPIPCAVCATGRLGREDCPDSYTSREDDGGVIGTCPIRNFRSFTKHIHIDNTLHSSKKPKNEQRKG